MAGDKGKALPTKTPVAPKNAAQTQTPEATKMLMNAFCQRASAFKDHQDASAEFKKVQSTLSGTKQSDYYSEMAVLKHRSDQAKDRVAKAKRKMEDIDQKLPALVLSFMENHNKQAITSDILESRLATLRKTLDAEMAKQNIERDLTKDKKQDQTLSDREAALTKRLGEMLEKKMMDREIVASQQFEQKLSEREAAMTAKLEQILSEREAAMSRKYERLLRDQEAKLKEEREAEKRELLSFLNDESVKNTRLHESLGELRRRLEQAESAASDARSHLSQLKGDIDMDKPGAQKLQNQLAIHEQQIQALESSREGFETQIREIKEATPRQSHNAPMGSGLSSEQLESRLLLHYKELTKDISKIDLRLEGLETVVNQRKAEPSTISQAFSAITDPQHPAASLDIMTKAEIAALVDTQMKAVDTQNRARFERVSGFLDTFLNRERQTREESDQEISAKLEQLNSSIAALETRLEALKTQPGSTEQFSQINSDMQNLKGRVDILNSILTEDPDSVKKQLEDLYHQISGLNTWQRNFNSAEITQQMVHYINSSQPLGIQHQVDLLLGRVLHVEGQVGSLSNSDSHKRRKVSANGAPVPVHRT
jgi:chromosome segregation ATPase